MQTIKEAMKGLEDSSNATAGCVDCIQLKVRENRKKKGEPVFVREDGKIGFPTINSIKINIGDTVLGRVQLDADTYFMFEVSSVIDHA